MPLTHVVHDVAVEGAAGAIRARLGDRAPRIAIILGSGLGALADAAVEAVRIPFSAIPGWTPATVRGHAGRVVAGTLDTSSVLLIAGRFHLYEGHGVERVVMPVRVAHALGARTLIVTNAAGGIRRTLAPGDLMLIADHLDLTRRSALRGAMRDGEQRFPDMSRPYDAMLLERLRAAAVASGALATEGVYGAVLGPSYETPAEIRMLERLGADAVGMSTVPEVIVARALGMRVAGISCITNRAAGLAAGRLTHDDVLEVTRAASGRLEQLIRELLRRLD